MYPFLPALFLVTLSYKEGWRVVVAIESKEGGMGRQFCPSFQNGTRDCS